MTDTKQVVRDTYARIATKNPTPADALLRKKGRANDIIVPIISLHLPTPEDSLKIR